MKAVHDTAYDLQAEEGAKNPAFRQIFEPWNKFHTDVMIWHRFAVNTCANFINNNTPKKG